MRAVVLGGPGAMGKIVTRDLVEFAEAGDRIIIADYNLAAARAYADLLRAIARKKKISVTIEACFADAYDIKGTAKILKGAFIVVNCIQYQLNLNVMKSALLAGVNYTDLGGLFHMTKKQLKLGAQFKKKGLTALLGMGAAPGITNILAAQGAKDLDAVTEIHARVASRDLTKYKDLPALPVSYSLQTILEEFSLKPAVYMRGKMKFVAPMSGDVPHSFPHPVGVQRPMYTLHSETLTLPSSFKSRGVKEVSFKIAFDPTFTDRVRFLRDFGLASSQPIRVESSDVKPIALVNKIAMSQKPGKVVGSVKQHEYVRTIVKGTKNGKKVTRVMDCYNSGNPAWGFGTDINTGCPPAIAARMLWRGEITLKGAIPPEMNVPEDIFVEELKKRKIICTSKTVQGWGLTT